MLKVLISFILYCVVCITLFGPFILILLGFYNVFTAHILSGIIFVILGFILLRLIKPISILFNKDLKIM